MKKSLFFIFSLFLLSDHLYCGHPLVFLIGHSRSCSTIFERAIYERGDFKCLHEPFSFVHFSNQEGEKSADINLFKGDYLFKNYLDLIDYICDQAEKQPVMVKDLSIGFKHILGNQKLFERENTFFIFLLRHPAKTFQSLFNLDPAYQYLGDEFPSFEMVYNQLSDLSRNVILIGSEHFVAAPEIYLENLAKWVGIPFIPGTSEFKSLPPEDWRDHFEWCSKAIHSKRIESAIESSPKNGKNTPDSNSIHFDNIYWDNCFIEPMNIYNRLCEAEIDWGLFFKE